MRATTPTPPISRIGAALVLVVVLQPASAGGLRAQTGEEVMRTALEHYEQRMEGIENYTVVQETMGFEAETYFERTEAEGRSVFLPRSSTGSQAARRAPANPYVGFFEMAEPARREGAEEVDGESCHVIGVTDFEGIEAWNPGAGSGDGGFTPQSATFFVDTDDYLIRRLLVRGTSTIQGQPSEVSFTAEFRDYRDVDGVVHPFVTHVSVEGLQTEMSEEEQEEMRRSLEEMRAQMEEMPRQQREMMERMMGGQLERMETLLAQGAMDFTVQVTEIRVNEGPPGDAG
ncbi:MAG: hypothetical protein GWM92_11950 [Gemmatimonadetes bacterium]|nr:hypothetical protein [Gemmatimonadota bacterium]NIR79396.1 hypothetical protein [Gemmatimonadota bacterium]NIT88069.1 hypothetical protein [Gemmatimonadota bacterium]NIU31901.1 hypothetical protein [Gemmatimonadota bacterium]NIU36520.1 hypothetical protein [Gemmatimonadota bacterium]